MAAPACTWLFMGGHVSSVKILIDSGMDPDGALGEGWTPLTKAAERSHREVVKLLLDKGADPNGLEDRNDGPFGSLLRPQFPIQVAMNGDRAITMVRLLLEAGADPNVRCDRLHRARSLPSRPTPLDIAREKKEFLVAVDVVEALLGRCRPSVADDRASYSDSNGPGL